MSSVTLLPGVSRVRRPESPRPTAAPYLREPDAHPRKRVISASEIAKGLQDIVGGLPGWASGSYPVGRSACALHNWLAT